MNWKGEAITEVESAYAPFETLTDKFEKFTDSWNENLDTRHAKICDAFIKKRWRAVNFPKKTERGRQSLLYKVT